MGVSIYQGRTAKQRLPVDNNKQFVILGPNGTAVPQNYGFLRMGYGYDDF
jgi:hypothetical protein